MPEIRVGPAGSAEDLGAIAELFREYATAISHVFGMEDDLADLPGKYGPPGGLLLLGRVDGRAVGCVAYREFGPGVVELKRFYVRPTARGLGLGRRLVEAAVEDARARGFRRLVLDTAPDMIDAMRVYRSVGFREIPRYWDCPIDGAFFLGMTLAPDGGAGAVENTGEAGHGV